MKKKPSKVIIGVDENKPQEEAWIRVIKARNELEQALGEYRGLVHKLNISAQDKRESIKGLQSLVCSLMEQLNVHNL